MHCTAVHTPATLIQFRLHFNAIDSRLDTRAHKIPVQTTLNQHQPHRVHELSQHFPSVRNDNTYYYRCNGHHTIISLRHPYQHRQTKAALLSVRGCSSRACNLLLLIEATTSTTLQINEPRNPQPL